MKQMFLVCCTILLGSACKKDGNTPSENKKPYIGKWMYEYGVDWHMWIGTLHKDTTLAHPGEYIEFKTGDSLTDCQYHNGNLYYYTLRYQVINGILYCDEFPDSSKLIVSGNTLIIDASEPSNTQSLWWHYKK